MLKPMTLHKHILGLAERGLVSTLELRGQKKVQLRYHILMVTLTLKTVVQIFCTHVFSTSKIGRKKFRVSEAVTSRKVMDRGGGHW